jgi:hypothetical protein
MSICHLDSPDPCKYLKCFLYNSFVINILIFKLNTGRKIFIINTFCGFEKIRSNFHSMFQFKNVTQLNSRSQLIFIYHYLEKMNYVYSKMPLKNMFSLTWEKDFLSIPQKCFNDYHVGYIL